MRYRGHPTRLCVPDPEGSAFFPAWRDANPQQTGRGSRIEGIGRPRVEPSFVGQAIDRMEQVVSENGQGGQELGFTMLDSFTAAAGGTDDLVIECQNPGGDDNDADHMDITAFLVNN